MTKLSKNIEEHELEICEWFNEVLGDRERPQFQELIEIKKYILELEECEEEWEQLRDKAVEVLQSI